MVATIALSYNMGNSGGSWMAGFCNTKPGVHILEEWQRKLGVDDRSDQGALEFLQKLEQDPSYRVVGLIKGFGDDTVAYALSRGANIIAQYRHPIKVLHGTRHRKDKYRVWMRMQKGRECEPRNEEEWWVGHVQFYAWRYKQYLAYEHRGFELVPLEWLSKSIIDDRTYIQQLLSWWHQTEWTEEDLERAVRSATPRCRNGCIGRECWEEGWEPYPGLSWESRWDPPKEEIWEHWTSAQRQVFLQEFGDILVPLGYKEWKL